MIACWQEKIDAGTTSDHISAFWDIMPTLAEITGTTPPPNDGISLLPTFEGKKQVKHQYLYWEFPEGDGSKAIRMNNWKGYIGGIKKGNTTMQLFNLNTDPREQNDVANQFPEIVNELNNKMTEAHEEPKIKKFSM